MGIIQNFLPISLKLPTPSAGLGSCEAEETAVGPMGDVDARPARQSACRPAVPWPPSLSISFLCDQSRRLEGSEPPHPREGRTIWGWGRVFPKCFARC